MKTILTAAFLVLLALIWFNRQRVFLRDPLATVTRDGAPQSGIEIFINGSNDILLQQDATPHRILIQHWNQAPGTPVTLRCLQWVACLTDADHPTIIPLASDSPGYTPQAAFTDRETTFTLPNSTHLRITLR